MNKILQGTEGNKELKFKKPSDIKCFWRGGEVVRKSRKDIASFLKWSFDFQKLTLKIVLASKVLLDWNLLVPQQSSTATFWGCFSFKMLSNLNSKKPYVFLLIQKDVSSGENYEQEARNKSGMAKPELCGSINWNKFFSTKKSLKASSKSNFYLAVMCSSPSPELFLLI